MVLKSNGTVVAWGSGTGTNLPAGHDQHRGHYRRKLDRVKIPALAIRADGTMLTWGDNYSGDMTPPRRIEQSGFHRGSAPAYHGLALVNNGAPVILQPPVGLTAYTGR